MLETSASTEELFLVHNARCFADEIIGNVLRLPILKAFDLSDAAGFDHAVAILAGHLRSAAKGAEANAVREVVAVLDVDWSSTTPERRRSLVSASLSAAGKQTAIIPAKIRVPLGDAADSVVAATRSAVRQEQGLAISADLNSLDHRIAKHIVNSQGNFVRDEYGRRLDEFGGRARSIVADGIEVGLGRSEIASLLEVAAKDALVERSPFYWELIASSFVSQGRSFAQMSSYAEAGIQRYEIHAVLDEHTSNICRFLNGKTFTVGAALSRFEQLEQMQQPEDIKQLMPWVGDATDPETGQAFLYIKRGGERMRLADITRSGFGNRDDRGEYRSLVSDGKLSEVGLGPPPYHAFCRSTSLAVV